MISGAPVIRYSMDAEADRDSFRKGLKFPHVDAGDGRRIFGLPPTEVAVHPSEEDGAHELYLMCDDLPSTIRQLPQKWVRCSAPVERTWGTIWREPQ